MAADNEPGAHSFPAPQPGVEWRARLVGELEGDVLEVGVGAGENLPYYRRARHVWGIEPNPKRAAEARVVAAEEARVPVTIDEAPAERLPYPDASFDRVVSCLVFCSVNDPPRALAEIGRVLRPGGLLHMIEHVRPENRLFGGLATAITPVWSYFAWNCHPNRRTVQMVQQAGWQVQIHSRRWLFVTLTARPPVG